MRNFPASRFTKTIGLIALLVASGTATAGQKVGFVTLEGRMLDRPPAGGLMFSGTGAPLLREVVDRLEELADPALDLDGLVIRLRDLDLSSTQIEELGQALEKVSAAGRKVHVFADNYAMREILLGAHCDEMLLQSGGYVFLPGIYAEEMYFADALGSIGVGFDRVMVGQYKGAMETMAESGPTKAWDENISQLLDSLYDAMRAHLKEGRSLNDAQLDDAMRNCILSSGEAGVRYGLIDRELDRMDLDEHIAGIYGNDFEWDTSISLSDEDVPDFASMGIFEAFSTMMQMLSERPDRPTTRETIAIVHIDGAIVDGESAGSGLFGGATVGSRTIREALRTIEKDDNIKGVIVRIDSPGGSASASEAIWLGLRDVAAKKPVWTSVGSLAASGGYYIAVAGDRIFINPSTIVGSIGVVSGKLTLGGLYEKLHINVTPRARGPRGGFFNTLEPWNSSDRELMKTWMDRVYDLFVSRVTAGRPGIDIANTAEGRLFAGEKAVRMKMADGIGSINDAIDQMASSLDLEAGGLDIRDYPPPPSFEEMIEQMMGAGVMNSGSSASMAPFAVAIRELIGDRAWSGVRDSLNALMQLRDEPVVLTSPSVLIVH